MTGKLDGRATMELLAERLRRYIDGRAHTHEIATSLGKSDEQYKKDVLAEVLERTSWRVSFNASSSEKDTPEEKKERIKRLLHEVTTLVRNVVKRDYAVFVEGADTKA